jgi:hypothetical protein
MYLGQSKKFARRLFGPEAADDEQEERKGVGLTSVMVVRPT